MASLRWLLENQSTFRSRLMRWYRAHGRELPWRKRRDAYRVWVSEIMLQQTRVNAVLEHYRRFLKTFPTVQALAAASEAEVLAAWSGLGYYRRARRMRLAAQTVVEQHGGRFPRTAAELVTLPGIGRYTAAAIASIVYEEPRAVVDGNVERVISRMAGRKVPQPAIWETVQAIIPSRGPGDFNQAMMELGALVCTPQTPQCGRCPVKALCRSRDEKMKPGEKKARRQATAHFLYSHRAGKVKLVQRSQESSLMAGMWELPSTESRTSVPLLRVRHSITTTDYKVVVHGGTSELGRWVPVANLSTMPLTGLARKVLGRLGVFASRT